MYRAEGDVCVMRDSRIDERICWTDEDPICHSRRRRHFGKFSGALVLDLVRKKKEDEGLTRNQFSSLTFLQTLFSLVSF